MDNGSFIYRQLHAAVSPVKVFKWQ